MSVTDYFSTTRESREPRAIRTQARTPLTAARARAF